jgi:hypothetical protein
MSGNQTGIKKNQNRRLVRPSMYPETMKKRRPLAETYPDLAKEAFGWDPTEIHDLTNVKMQWICSKGHTWFAFTYTRTGGNPKGCPVCANKSVAVGSNDLKSQFPELANEADGWNPETISVGSQKKVGWVCSLNHRWDAPVSRRVKGAGCPYCSNNKILVGFNDLATVNPEVASEADGWNPQEASSGSSRKMKWICTHGHKWEASISSRTGKMKTGCPYCWGRFVIEGETDLETLFPAIASEASGWDPRTVNAGSKSKMNFKCPQGHIYLASVAGRVRGRGCGICAKKLIVSGVNDLSTTHPSLATEADGWDPTKVTSGNNTKKSWACKEFGHKWLESPNARSGRGFGCPICSGNRVLTGFNDLLTTNPELAIQAAGWNPQEFSAGSNVKVKWKCNLGHSWTAAIAHRTGTLSTGCPVCANQTVLSGFNDLKFQFPEIAKEADGWDPTEVGSGSNKKKPWICELGHKWKANVSSRTALGTGCPSCAKTGFDPNKDGWLYFMEHLDWEMLQIGITNVPDDRLAIHRRLGWTVLELRGPMNGDLAKQWETDILRTLRAKGAKLGNHKIAGRFSGYTESWMSNSYPVKSLKELMNLVQDNE